MVKCHVGDSDCQYSSNNTEHLHQDYADVHKIVIENVKMAYPNSVEFQVDSKLNTLKIHEQ